MVYDQLWLATNTTTSDTANTRFIIECYKRYLRRTVTTSTYGVQGWIDDLTNNYGGDPTNANGVRHMIAAFITSTEYRLEVRTAIASNGVRRFVRMPTR